MLFTNGLTKYRDLSQPGQFVAAETVILAGPKGSIERVRVLGPARGQTQAEISVSDAYKLESQPISENPVTFRELRA